MSFEEQIANQVRGLANLDLIQLRREWRRRYGTPPTTRSVDLIARLLAWRIQAEALGGLDEPTIKLLYSARSPPPPPVALELGTRLARDWRGVRHEVEVSGEGFHHQGTLYRSLSEVARSITGTRWNGLRFFGLREANRR
ncbi:DUF2924 domain-containing protein [Sphingomonas sp. RB1R13]|uniref:DUF2924 domain-containing protein n=1 Tax=Sphingomonas sp. RB1R13 TaxID=3096159 RepID=UPI002FCAF2B1